MVDDVETEITAPLRIHRVPGAMPANELPVLVWHSTGVDRGALYGNVWRHFEYGEDQLHGVYGWAEIPEFVADSFTKATVDTKKPPPGFPNSGQHTRP